MAERTAGEQAPTVERVRRTVDRADGAAHLSQEVLDSVEAGQRTALDMADKQVTTQHDCLRSVRSADCTLTAPRTAKRWPSERGRAEAP